MDIAVYNLYARRHDSMPDVRDKRYDNAVKFLGKVAAGTITLGADDPDGNPPASSGIASRSARQVMTREKLRGF